jgi:hypothetical protein
MIYSYWYFVNCSFNLKMLFYYLADIIYLTLRISKDEKKFINIQGYPYN